MKWYEKILVGLFIILLSPLIVFLLILWFISLPFIAIHERREYKKSAYYKNICIPFNKQILYSSEYDFYNYAMKEKLPIKFVKQKNNSLAYFIYQEEIFIFPDFQGIEYSFEKDCWEVIYRKKKIETRYALDVFFDMKKELFEESISLPIQLLISQNYFCEEVEDLSNVPESLYVIRNYHSAFKDENNELRFIVLQNTKQLYEMMMKNPKLGGKIELENDERIIWTFEKVIYDISVDKDDGFIDVLKNNRSKTSITHWHPSNDEIYDEICRIGERGNVLVIKSFLESSAICYIGSVKNCPYKKNKRHFCRFYYFESL